MKRLTVQQIIDLANECTDTYRKHLKDLLIEQGADQAIVIAELKQHDRKRGNLTDLVLYAQTAEGAVRIVKMAGQDPETLSPDDLVDAAFRCLGYDLDSLAAKARAANPDPTLSRSP